MKVAYAIARYVRVSPRKLRLVADLIREENTTRALGVLSGLNKPTKASIEKLLRSAISNAGQNSAVDTNQLYISKITVDKGPMLKRFQAQAMGRATMIRHRTSHIKIELSSQKQKPVGLKKKPASKLLKKTTAKIKKSPVKKITKKPKVSRKAKPA